MESGGKKRLAIISVQKRYAEHAADLIKMFFADTLEFRCYDTEQLLEIDELQEECILLSYFTIFQQVKQKVRKDAQILIMDLTFRKDAVEPLKAIPGGTKALLVNLDYRNCMESITMISSMGITDLELIPYYPGCEWDSSIKLAVTAGEADLVPPGMERVIDLGSREVDANTIYSIAKAMGIENPFRDEETIRLRDNLVNRNLEMDYLFSENNNLSVQLNTLLGLVKKGVLITDVNGRVCMANQMARGMTKKYTDFESCNLEDILPEIELDNDGENADYVSEQLIHLNGRIVAVSVSPIESSGRVNGHIIMMEYFEQAEDRQHKLRKKLRDSEHRATYTFDQILGNSSQIQETKRIAKRMAQSDSSICLYGESGTGKELFAQSIHNYSRRKDYQFVAINCAALPENLLESELYGYEEGAFSGAKKGGQIGLFELAHQGTLFLDEIEEMSMKMQAKLLRAIEEQKIIRVGGRKLIDVDVRIICASNQELKTMVKEGSFRRDLYYRLHVLPIKIPPLTERKEDVLLLMDSLKKDIGAEYALTKEAEIILEEYSWPGNVRELKNITEYLANLGYPLIAAEDIPLDVEDIPDKRSKSSESCTEGETLRQFVLKALKRQEDEGGCGMGRKLLAELAAGAGFAVTEQKLRRLLHKMVEEGVITAGKGRQGSMLTEKGKWEIGDNG